MNKTRSLIAAICVATIGTSASFAQNNDDTNYAPASYAPAPYSTLYAEESADVDVAEEGGEEDVDRWFSGSMVGTWLDGFLREGNGRAANLNQIWLTGEKAIDTSLRPIDFGGRIDAVFGTTNAQCADGGFDGRWGVSGDGYATSLYQAYGEIGIKKLSVKVGKFETNLGYEPTDVSLSSHNTATHMSAREPGTHCGVLFNYAFSDAFSVDFGMVSGSDNSFENRFGDTGFLFGATFAPEDNFTLSYASELNQTHAANFGSFSYGYYDLGGKELGDKNEYLQTVTLETKLSDKLNFVLTSNYGTMEDREEKIERYRQVGAVGYLLYQLTDQINANLRYEYYTQKLVQEGVEARYHDVGFALIYRPTENVFIRPDARYDWIDEGERADGFTGGVSCGVLF